MTRKAKLASVAVVIVALTAIKWLFQVGRNKLGLASSIRGSKQQLSEFCQGNGSLHEIAMEMSRFSSPPGSASYNKTHNILRNSEYFHIELPARGIFVNVAENMATLLQGFGLQPWGVPDPSGLSESNSTFPILMEISYYAIKAQRQNDSHYICQTAFNCSQIPRIIIQSEQLEHVGGDYLELLRECHNLPQCVIWDFSDHHYQWAQHHNISDSVMTLPVMHQSLLQDEEYLIENNGDSSADVDPALSLAQRPIDLVFFGKLTDRRQGIQNTLSTSQTYEHWNVRFERTINVSHIKEQYIQSKVCLIVHSYSNTSAGEYHRLNELATVTVGAGCVPVVEEWADRIGHQAYQECGGVVFASYDNILRKVEQVLQDIHNNPRAVENRQELHSLWWANSIRWGVMLADIFEQEERS